MTLPIKMEERVTHASIPLEECLHKLCEYGKPRLSSQGNGEWYCAIEMFVQGIGVDFKVASSFKEPSAHDAVNVCYERLKKALSDLGLPMEKNL